MTTARIFVTKTRLTPDDADVIVNRPPGWFDDYDEAHVSVTFTWDMDRAEWLAERWSKRCKVRIGGPATGERGVDFVPGMYVKKGAVITSRGCPNRCWFCPVWRREGDAVRELSITDGWNILDDNLLRCSETHIRNVFQMLKRQPHKAQFTGGLEAAVLQDWHIDLLADLKPEQIFFAYDTPDDFEPLRRAGRRLQEAGFTRHHLRAYCLIGYAGDTFENAEKRLADCVKAGFFPMAMLFRDEKGSASKEWRNFQRAWARPAIVYAKTKGKGL